MKCVFIVMAVLFFLMSCRGFSSRDAGEIGDSVLSIPVLLPDSNEVINPRILAGKDPVVIVFFQSYCHYCQGETESIVKNIEKFGSTRFYFLSNEPFSEIRWYANKFNLQRYKNVHIGIDTSGKYIEYFKLDGVPHTSVYKEKLLFRVFTSQVNAEELLKVLRE